MAYSKTLRVVATLCLAILIFGAESKLLGPWIGSAVESWAYRSGAETTIMRVWVAPVLIGLVVIVFFVAVALWGANTIIVRLLARTGANHKPG